MAIWYVDPENGNDSNDGTSFANRVKRFHNPTGLADGDEIRIIKSPDATSIGNATWMRDATFIDLELNENTTRNGVGDFNGQASGSPTTVADTAHGLQTGDAIWVTSDGYLYAGIFIITKVDNDNFTLDGTESAPNHDASSGIGYKRMNPFCVRLATSPIKNILCNNGLDGSGDKDWTAVQGTTGRETGFRSGSGYRACRYFRPGATSISGKVAYCQLDNALDLSGYQQISFRVLWDYAASGTHSQSNVVSLRLCTDTQGDTSVHTISVPTPAGDDDHVWHTVTVDLGTNLNSSIQSVALHWDVATTNANDEIILDNIIACKAKSSNDSLTLSSLISKGNTHNSNWYPIMGIVGKIVVFDHQQFSGLEADQLPSKIETTETVTTYKREPHRNVTFESSLEQSESPFIDISGHHNITISGGWNTTDMSSQDSNSGSWLAQTSFMYVGMKIARCTRVNISKIAIVKGYADLNWDQVDHDYPTFSNTITDCSFILTNRFRLTSDCTYSNCIFNANSNYQNVNAPQNFGNIKFLNCKFINVAIGWLDNYSNLTFVGCSFQGGARPNHAFLKNTDFSTSGEYLEELQFYNCTFDHINIAHGEDWVSHYSFANCTFTNLGGTGDHHFFVDEVDYDSGYKDDRLPNFAFINYNNTANDHRLYYPNCIVKSDTSIKQSASSYSWKMTPLAVTANRTRSVNNPLDFVLGKVYVSASTQVTVTIYARRTDTNTDDYVCLAALLHHNASIGLTSDAKSSALSGSANTWQQLTLTFTPTVAGVATISALMSASSTSDSVYVDEMSISQA